ncbi:MAG: phosphatase PAP2 family protein [Pirellulales bacterium]
MPADVDQSAFVEPADALVVIDWLNSEGAGLLPPRSANAPGPRIDVDNDGTASSRDALLVVNLLNRPPDPLALVAGLSPESDPNGNGVVLVDHIRVSGQTIAGARVVGRYADDSPGNLAWTTADAAGRFALELPIDSQVQLVRITSYNDHGRTISRDVPVVLGDVVRDWNAAALDVVRAWTTTSNDPYEGRIVTAAPPVVARNLAMLHGAMFDTINSFEKLYEPYLLQVDPPNDADPMIAAAFAAHTVATRLYGDSDERLVWDATLAESLAAMPAGFRWEASEAVGKMVAEAMLSARSADGSTIRREYQPGSQPGDWNRTAPGFLPPLLTNWPDVTPFAVSDPADYLPDPPPDLASVEYATAVDEVMRLGEYSSSERTEDQTEIALYWADGGGTFTPPGHWNQIASDAVGSLRLPLIESARTMSLVNFALADAGIVSWTTKYEYELWRPIDAIRRADEDGNDQTQPAPDWMPLLVTPPFPSYTSGHSTFSGAAAAVLTTLLGDHYAFSSQADSQSAPSQRPLADDLLTTRSFASFYEAAHEAGESRVFGGIHYRFDHEAGFQSGKAVGEYVASTLLARKNS